MATDPEGNSGPSSSPPEQSAARAPGIPGHWVLLIALGVAVASAVWFHESPAASPEAAAARVAPPVAPVHPPTPGATDPGNDLSLFVEPEYEGDPHAGVPGAPSLAGGAMAAGEANPHGALSGENPHPGAGVASDTVVVAHVVKAEGKKGRRVAELFAQRRTLKDQSVRVRGVVVKVIERVLDRTFVHLRDGSETAEVKDLVVTTQAAPAVGDRVLFEGKVTTEKDFGAGYVYPVLLEDAALIDE